MRARTVSGFYATALIVDNRVIIGGLNGNFTPSPARP